jgi:hypothetical protein
MTDHDHRPTVPDAAYPEALRDLTDVLEVLKRYGLDDCAAHVADTIGAIAVMQAETLMSNTVGRRLAPFIPPGRH